MKKHVIIKKKKKSKIFTDENIFFPTKQWGGKRKKEVEWNFSSAFSRSHNCF